MMAPALPQIAEHYGITSATITAMTLSIFLLSFAIGPLFLGPLSEMYGRVWVSSVLKLQTRKKLIFAGPPYWEFILSGI